MQKTIKTIATLLTALVLPSVLIAQEATESVELDELDVSYIYATVMGSGTYKIDDRRISMLRLPFAFTQRDSTEEQAGIKWYAPVVIGYDSLGYPDWIDRLLEDDLMTLSVLPGFEYQKPLNLTWVLKPYVNLGGGYDFSRGETILMGAMGARILGTWVYDDESEFRFGASTSVSAEYQIESSDRYSFSQLEGGVDYRRNTQLPFFEQPLNAGAYYRAQLFLPRWNIEKDETGKKQNLEHIHELGISLGFKEARKVLFFSVSRVRMGFKFGESVQGWTIGSEFPF